MNNIRYKSESFRGGEAITPSDTVNITDPVSAIYVGGLGNIVAVMDNGDVLTFIAVPVGTVLPLACVRVNATGTTATNLVGLK